MPLSLGRLYQFFRTIVVDVCTPPEVYVDYNHWTCMNEENIAIRKGERGDTAGVLITL